MKKVFLFALMLAIAASCSVTEIDSIQGTTAPEITASYGDNGTRTILITDDEGVGTIWWKPADEINVFYETASAHYTSKNTENATTVAFGTTDVIGFSEASQNNIWGLYPYDEYAVCDGESVTTTIPATQQAIAGSFDDDLFTSLAHSTSTVMTFYNVLGGIKFSLSRDDIQTITFKGNNDEDIAGKVKLKMDANDRPVAEITGGEKIITLTPKEGTTFAKNTNYYLVMLPTVLSNGFTMTFETEDKVGTFEYTENPIEIKRSVFSKKENIDSYATFEDKDYKSIPFTISSIGSTSVALMKEGTPDDITLEYRKGEGNWSAYTVGSTISLANGEFVQFRAGEGGNEYFSKDFEGFYYFVVSGNGTVKASGNIMSLLDKIGERTTMPKNGFYRLFSGCHKLVDASKLELPATTLDDYCYYDMFWGCTSLVSAPAKLPATTLADRCYCCMFLGCTSLQAAPELPATTLAYGCYDSMFSTCTSLVTAPELPATTLADHCYYYMFYGCTSLVSAPAELPATTFANHCYDFMFYNCTSLVNAPELPATTLAEHCYGYMFSGCTSLVSAPELPATTLADHCYYAMFSGCTSLVSAPELPATTLADYCYYDMFSGCISLVTAPKLPATTLVVGCYGGMFNYCSNLNYVKALFETEPSSYYTKNWLNGVSSTGTFVKSKDATWDVTGLSGIPKGWTVQILGETSITLDKTEASLEVGETLSLTATVSPENATDKTVSWSSDKTDVATVDTEGSVHAVAPGTATITVTTVDGGKRATCTVTVKAALPEGALAGKFSVSATKKVHFSKGNLVATINASGTPTAWKFAANQHDCLGEGGANKTIGIAEGDIDLFGWSTVSTTYGISTSTSSSSYSGDFFDWGIAYCKKNSITPDNTWRTLSRDEWTYLFYTRTVNGGKGAGKSYSLNITYGGKMGVVLYPDDYTDSVLSGTVDSLPEGVVFLPAAGYRDGSYVVNVGDYGYYWSSTADGSRSACYVTFLSYGVCPDNDAYRYVGYSVRLITESK